MNDQQALGVCNQCGRFSYAATDGPCRRGVNKKPCKGAIVNAASFDWNECSECEGWALQWLRLVVRAAWSSVNITVLPGQRERRGMSRLCAALAQQGLAGLRILYAREDCHMCHAQAALARAPSDGRTDSVSGVPWPRLAAGLAVAPLQRAVVAGALNRRAAVEGLIWEAHPRRQK